MYIDLHTYEYNVTYNPIARQGLGKHILMGEKARNNMTFIAR
jgi:hypothetical protein